MDDAGAARIRQRVSDGVNWPEVLATAIQHKVRPLVFEALQATAMPSVPAVWMEVLRDSVRAMATWNFVLFGETLKLAGAFAQNGVPLIPYKGPVLSWIAYGSLARRTFRDLDFYLERSHLERARQMLREAGYRERPAKQDAQSGVVAESPGIYLFHSDSARLRVRLRTETSRPDFPGGLNLPQMSERLQSIEIGGRKLSTFSLEDTLTLLCASVTRHFGAQLSLLTDVAGLIQRNELDWGRALELAARMKRRRALLLGVYSAHTLLDAPVPDAVLRQAARESGIPWLDRRIHRYLSGDADPETGVMARAAYRMRSQDGWSEALRYLSGRVSEMARRPGQGGPAPSQASALWRVLRLPATLLAEYRAGIRPASRPDLAGFLPMRPEMVDRLLEFAEVKPNDVLYDLGCGDGRIVVAAAEKYGIRAIGVDVDPRRIAEARAKAREHRVERLVGFLLEDARTVDLSDATVVTLYMGTDGVLRLADSLKRRLKPGVRLISCESEIYGWPSDTSAEYKSRDGDVTPFYLWKIRHGGAEPSQLSAQSAGSSA